jgi:hypothetical protein
MSETPLAKLVRVLGGILLSQGRLGHQVLGQMLILDLNQAEFAAAALVVTAGMQRPDLFTRTAVSVVAPAVALQIAVDKAERRLDRREEDIERREKALARRSAAERGGAPVGAPVAPAPPVAPVVPAPAAPLGGGDAAAHAQIAQLNLARLTLEARLKLVSDERDALARTAVRPRRARRK